ncbi:phospholipid phosphatase-related protein type 3 [Trichechus inunguis]
MISAKEKNKTPKDSMTLLPCFYFVEIMVGEGVLYCLQSRLWGRGGDPGGAEGSINAGGCNFNSFLRRTVRFVGVHVFGLCATALVTDVIQLATGYHAPFFLTVCKPNYTLLGTSCEANPYITQDICSGADAHAILSARKTFPSQHATLSAFAAAYVSMYFNSVISDTTKLLKPILVFAFTIAAGVCGLTQITQYRSHPVDVYAGFLIGAGIAAYLACHAVGNFQAPPAERPAVAAAAPAKDALRALTQRGHDSVYQQNKSVSTDELGPPGRLEGAPRPVARDKSSLGSLKRASVDVDLLAPRSPMGKENMVTFSNTLPRVSTPSLDDPARRHMTIHVPLDASRSKQLITEWKQKSLEGRGLGLPDEASPVHLRAPAEPMAEEEEEEEDDEEEEEEEEEEGGPVPPSLYPTVQARPGLGPRVILPPRAAPQPLVHIPEEGAQAGAGLSPKSGAAVRAKWLMMAEKTGAAVAATQPRVANPPRLLQVLAMSKAPGGAGAKAAETGSSSSASSDSSQYRSPSDRDSASIVTIDAHAPHHPVVHLSAGNGPWEWKAAGGGAKGPEGDGTYELGDLARGFRGGPRPPGVSPGSSISDVDQEEPRFGAVATVNLATGEGLPPLGAADGALGPASRESTLRRKAGGLALGERDALGEAEAESYYRKMQAARRFKE